MGPVQVAQGCFQQDTAPLPSGWRGHRAQVSGAAMSAAYAREMGADAYCVDGFEAVKLLDSFQ